MADVIRLLPSSAHNLYRRILAHLVSRIRATKAHEWPFTHAYFTDLLPEDVFREILIHLPAPEAYETAAERHYERGEGNFVRSMFALTTTSVSAMTPAASHLFRAVAAALTAPETKQAVFTLLARDISFRYGVPESATAEVAGYSRPTLYRETEGFEIPAHPDTRKKVVTMHLYFPEDLTQIGLGTALYRRKPLALPVGDWKKRFERVKQFEFRPNSGYAFVVNNTLTKRSWHGREQLPPGSGVRNTLLNTFYETPREGYFGYLEERPATRAA